MAQKLSHQLRAAEDRIAELEAEVDFTASKAAAPSNGSTMSIPRLKSDLSGRRREAPGLLFECRRPTVVEAIDAALFLTLKPQHGRPTC